MAPLTAHSHLFVAIHEDGLNLIALHVMRQRPSMFNYASADVAGNRELWCADVTATQDVFAFGNPLFTVQQPLPVLGTTSPPAAVSWSGQVVRMLLDVQPSDVVKLPPELQPPLPAQHFAVELDVTGQIGCPGVKQLAPAEPHWHDRAERDMVTVVLPNDRKPHCFELRAFAVGHVEVQTIDNAATVVAVVDDVDIVGLGAEPVEDTVSCYLRTALNLVLFQRLRIPMSAFLLHFDHVLGAGTIASSLAAVPHDPALQHDRIELFVNLRFA
jgi:hypothetical protein